MQGNWTVLDSQFCSMDTDSGFFVSGTWILDSNYKWDPEYLTFIPDSKRKISQIPDSLTWGDSDPTINMFSVKLKPVN